MINIFVARRKFLSHMGTRTRMTRGYISDDTRRTYDGALRRLEVYLTQRQMVVLEDVKVDHLKEYLAKLREGGLQARTAALHRVILRSFFHWANANYAHIVNIAKDLEPIRIERREAKHLTTDEISNLLTYLWKDRKSKRRNAILFEIIIRTGARVGEISAMNMDSLILSQEGIKIFLIGKGNKKRSLDIPLLAEGQPGSVEIRRFHDHLEEYFGRRRRWKVKPGDEQALFLTNAGHRITPRRIQSAFKYYRRRLNLHGCTPHSLRHSYLTHLLQRGVDLATVSRLAGHSSIQVTAASYLHSDPQKLQEAATKAFLS